jgi:hypothetical protein
MTVIPGYGRDYTSAAKALADWENGRDFQVDSIGPNYKRYTSIRDGHESITIRFNCKRLAVYWKKPEEND